MRGAGSAGVRETIEVAARARPDAIAVVGEDGQWTFGAIDRCAERLARRLRAMGVGPDDTVALCMDRSAAMVTCILAAWKAGAAYLPLNPGDPRARLRAALDAARPRVVLTPGAAPGWIAPGCPCLSIDGLLADVPGAPAAPPGVEAGDENLGESIAYVLFTSGSTGVPKGVAVPFGALANHMRWMLDAFSMGREERTVLKTAMTFDASVWEVCAPLMAGGLMVIARPSGERDPEYLGALLSEHDATTVQFVPPMLEACVAAGAFARARNLARVFCGGDRLSDRTVVEFASASPAPLYNLYGPTEATIDATCSRARPGSSEGGCSIGRPIAGVHVGVVDPHGDRVPAGEEGELLIGGDGLARGYVGDPAATASRFVPDALGGRPGARAYRSGDWGGLAADGELRFRGRNDDLVKVRGHRVTLGEIESALRGCPDVGAAAVVPSNAGGESLVAFVRWREPGRGDETAVRELLARWLPEYMLPHAIIALDGFPLTSSGKVDRRALVQMVAERGRARPPSGPLEGATEAALADVWATVLAVPRPGSHDNFFQLGGDSIKSIRAVALAAQRGLSHTVEDIFQCPTVRGLAARCRPTAAPARSGPESAGPFSLIAPEQRSAFGPEIEDAYPMSSIQRALYFLSQTSASYEVYVTSFEVHAAFREPLLRSTLDALARRHAWLRTSLDVGRYGEPMQVVRARATIPLEVHDVSDEPATEQRRLVLAWLDERRARRFDWRSESFLAVSVHVLGPARFRLTLSEPVFDGWSVSTLVAEMLSAYDALLRGEAFDERPPPAVAYRDFIRLEREASASPQAEAFWLGALADWPAARLPRLPSGTGRAPAGVGRELLHFPRSFAAKLRRLSADASIPMKSLLFAVHAKVMAFVHGTACVPLGMMVNGRPEGPGGDGVLGIFLNTIPVLLRMDPEDSWLDLAWKAFRAETEALPHRRYPLPLMQSKSGIKPLFEAAFNFTHFHVFDRLKARGGLTVGDYLAWDQTFFPLMAQFHVDAFSGSLVLALDYDPCEFQSELVRTWARYYRRALVSMASAPRESHASRPLVAAPERRGRLSRCEGPKVGSAVGGLSEMLIRAGRERPDAIGLESGDGQVTYRALGLEARALARRLKAQGVGPDVCVAVLAERSVGLVVALLGVLLAGGGYQPLDPDLPARRLAALVRDSQARLVVCDRACASRAPEGVPTLLWEPGAARDGAAADAEAHDDLPDALAYVLHTSGSSGGPKGVQVTRRALANFLASMADRPGLDAHDTVLATTPVSFDIAALELLGPLATGARAVVLERAAVSDGFRLGSEIQDRGATCLQGTPSNWRLLLATGWSGCDALRAWCGGERLTGPLAAALRGRVRALWNLYGPTETTVWSSAGAVDGEDVTLGDPIADTLLCILDPALDLGPRYATPGEVYIGGVGLARGYLRRPDLTAERFVPDSVSGRVGARLYRTGDLGVHDRSGRIRYVGRRDGQLKVRGLRIEPAEVEAAICSFPGISQAVVRSVGDDARGTRLLAYLVTAAGAAAPTVRALREFLRERLPEQMVPARFHTLDRVPLTPNGKVDRGALPDEGHAEVDAEGLERLLAHVEGLPEGEAREALARERASARRRREPESERSG